MEPLLSLIATDLATLADAGDVKGFHNWWAWLEKRGRNFSNGRGRYYNEPGSPPVVTLKEEAAGWAAYMAGKYNTENNKFAATTLSVMLDDAKYVKNLFQRGFPGPRFYNFLFAVGVVLVRLWLPWAAQGAQEGYQKRSRIKTNRKQT